MTHDLKTYIKDLTEATAARQRIESELSVAAEIQRNMLPSTFPPFPERDEFDIHAVMRPAREVGGDLYDFFLLDEHRLCVIVGDVSGKGVPAALLMTVTKYLIEVCAGEGAPPDEVLRRVNNQLARNNEACMFVTTFIGILDWRTGEFLFASGGHNPALLSEPDGETTFLDARGDPAIGLLPDAQFMTHRLVLRPGALIVAYTDGVTEAFNAQGEAFSEERLRDSVRGLVSRPSREIVERLVQEIDSFCSGEPQTDDITIVALRFTPTTGSV
jgi:sigma-B regulation protein RsbU (phosphoserine phosphatase)